MDSLGFELRKLADKVNGKDSEEFIKDIIKKIRTLALEGEYRAFINVPPNLDGNFIAKYINEQGVKCTYSCYHPAIFPCTKK